MAKKSQLSMKTKLQRLLQNAFSGAQVELEFIVPGKVGGSLIWKGFLGKDQIDRQRALRKALTEHLDSEEQLKVSSILTFTPDEIAVMDRG